MKFKLVEELTESRQERTVYNALASWENYAYKYGKSEALFNLKYNFHLTDEELAWILKKLVKKDLIDESDFDWNIKYLKLEDQFPDKGRYFPEEEIEDGKLEEGIKETSIPKINEEPYPLNNIAFSDVEKEFYIYPNIDDEFVFLDIPSVVETIPVRYIVTSQLGIDNDKFEKIKEIGLDRLPPISVVDKDGDYYLFDGNHRVQLANEQSVDNIKAKVYKFEDVEEAYYDKLNELENNQLIEKYLDDEEEFYDYGTGEAIDKDIFDINRGESPYAREMIKLSKTGDVNEKGLGAEIIQMTPKEYFEDMARGFNSTFDKQIKQIEYDKKVLDHLKQVITKYKRKFPITYINVDSDYGNFEQEGRHRMYVAGELFGWDTKFPVLKIFEKDKERADKIRLEKKKEKYLSILRTALRKAESYSYRDLDELKEQVDYELESEFSYQDDPNYSLKVEDKGDNIDFILNNLVTITRDKEDFSINPNKPEVDIDTELDDLSDEDIAEIEKELGIKFGESLNEGRDAYFYHGTSPYFIIDILKDNELKLKAGAPAISFARDIKVAEDYGDIILVLDQNKLSQNYKITPVSDYVRNYAYKDGNPSSPSRRLNYNKTEEQIYRNIKPLDKYLVKIIIQAYSEDTLREVAERIKKYTDRPVETKMLKI